MVCSCLGRSIVHFCLSVFASVNIKWHECMSIDCVCMCTPYMIILGKHDNDLIPITDNYLLLMADTENVTTNFTI